MDQYRVTREVPLPYSIDDLRHASDMEEDMDEDAVSRRSWRPGRRRALSLARERAARAKQSSDGEPA